MCKKVNQRKIFSQNLTMNKVWISGQLVCGAYFVLFQEKRKIVHIHISVHANFYLNWLSVTLIITFLRFKINFLYCSTLSSSNFTTWGELLALKPRTVNNLLNLLSEWDLFSSSLYVTSYRSYRMRENCERKSDPTFAAIQAVPHQSSRRISVSGLLFWLINWFYCPWMNYITCRSCKSSWVSLFWLSVAFWAPSDCFCSFCKRLSSLLWRHLFAHPRTN